MSRKTLAAFLIALLVGIIGFGIGCAVCNTGTPSANLDLMLFRKLAE